MGGALESNICNLAGNQKYLFVENTASYHPESEEEEEAAQHNVMCIVSLLHRLPFLVSRYVDYEVHVCVHILCVCLCVCVCVHAYVCK